MIDALRDKDSQPMTFQRHESRYQSKEASTRKHKDQETEWRWIIEARKTGHVASPPRIDIYSTNLPMCTKNR